MSVISSAASAAAAATTTSTSSSSLASSLGTDTFIKLLTTQLQYQNPLDPMDPTEFTKQLATYAQLEQQITTNEKLDSLTTAFASMQGSIGLAYLGSTAELDSNMASVNDGSASWSYTLPDDAKSVTIKVTNSDGETVYQGSGETDSGKHTLTLDSDDFSSAVANGDALTLSVTAKDSTGASMDVTTTSFAAISALSGSGTDFSFESGDLTFTVDSILKLTNSN